MHCIFVFKEDDGYLNKCRITAILPYQNAIWIGTGDGNLIIFDVSERPPDLHRSSTSASPNNISQSGSPYFTSAGEPPSKLSHLEDVEEKVQELYFQRMEEQKICEEAVSLETGQSRTDHMLNQGDFQKANGKLLKGIDMASSPIREKSASATSDEISSVSMETVKYFSKDISETCHQDSDSSSSEYDLPLDETPSREKWNQYLVSPSGDLVPKDTVAMPTPEQTLTPKHSSGNLEEAADEEQTESGGIVKKLCLPESVDSGICINSEPPNVSTKTSSLESQSETCYSSQDKMGRDDSLGSGDTAAKKGLIKDENENNQKSLSKDVNVSSSTSKSSSVTLSKEKWLREEGEGDDQVSKEGVLRQQRGLKERCRSVDRVIEPEDPDLTPFSHLSRRKSDGCLPLDIYRRKTSCPDLTTTKPPREVRRASDPGLGYVFRKMYQKQNIPISDLSLNVEVSVDKNRLSPEESFVHTLSPIMETSDAPHCPAPETARPSPPAGSSSNQCPAAVKLEHVADMDNYQLMTLSPISESPEGCGGYNSGGASDQEHDRSAGGATAACKVPGGSAKQPEVDIDIQVTQVSSSSEDRTPNDGMEEKTTGKY